MKKILASILALCLVLSTMGTIAFADGAVVEVSTYDQLLAALADDVADTIVMQNDIKAVVNESNGYGTTGINILKGDTLDGNGYTLELEVLDKTWDSAVTTIGGTIKNLTINNGFRGIFITHITGYSGPIIPVVLENVTIDGTTYTISCDQGMYQTLTATNCTFNGWTSFAATLGEAKFVNCEFGEGNGYAYFRPFADTNLEGCDFEEGFKMDGEKADTEMVACTYAGELITSENIGDLINTNTDKVAVDDTAVENKVAYILGKGGYDTLEAAFKAVEANDTVKLLSDVTTETKWNCNFGRGEAVGTFNNNPVTIDGNGHTLKFTGEINDGYNQLAVFRTEADLTVKDLTVDMSEAIAVFQNRFSVISCEENDLTVENCTFIGSTTYTNGRAIIFGEGAASHNDAKINVNGCTFENWKYGVTDNTNGSDVASVTVTGSDFTNASINVSASENVTIEGNEVDGGYVSVTSYTQPNELAVTVQNNVLDEDFAEKNAVLAGKEINVQDGISMTAVAECNGYRYSSLSNAIAGANSGDTITLLGDAELNGANIKKALTIDLANNTLTLDAKPVTNLAGITVAGIHVWDNVTFANGNVDVICEENIANGVFYIGNSSNAVLELSNVTLTVNDTKGSTLFLACNPGLLKITNSVIDAKNVPYFINGGDKGSAVISGSKINVSDSVRGLLNINVDVDDSEFNVSNLSNNAFRNISGTINNTKISANGYASGLKNDAGLELVVDGTSELKFTGATGEGEYDIYMKNGATLDVADTASVYGDKTLFEGTVTGDVISRADIISVEFALDEENSSADDGYLIYDIKVIGANSEVINRLNTADLTFEISDSVVSYEITPADKITLTTDAKYADRYMFNFKGKDDVVDTANEIVIGQVKFTGYDTFTFGVKDVETNLVTATTIRDNIVDEFKASNNTLVVNRDTVLDDENIGSIDATIEVPKRTLTVNVEFPNIVKDNGADYQNMTVTISGGDLDADIVTALGDGDYTVEEELTLNTAYTVTVKGLGYRTARYTVTMTGAKTLNFWNNVMDNAKVVEVDEDASAVTKNFLAGDIVADNMINIYDLSAAVSYFTESAYNNAEYIKYDLNRDGVIDSKDVAYILVSWGE